MTVFLSAYIQSSLKSSIDVSREVSMVYESWDNPSRRRQLKGLKEGVECYTRVIRGRTDEAMEWLKDHNYSRSFYLLIRECQQRRVWTSVETVPDCLLT